MWDPDPPNGLGLVLHNWPKLALYNWAWAWYAWPCTWKHKEGFFPPGRGKEQNLKARIEKGRLLNGWEGEAEKGEAIWTFKEGKNEIIGRGKLDSSPPQVLMDSHLYVYIYIYNLDLLKGQEDDAWPR